MLRAEGVWITDTAGRTYLDAYNNVPCVGHAHPRVTTAIARQSRRINTHTRYLHPSAIELAERLAATCPPELDTVMLVNSGSEANDLAWRMATAVTGNRGGLCTAHAYHGITEAIAALSPEGWFGAPGPDHVETWEPRSALAPAIERLRRRGYAPAAAILDGVVTSDGIFDLEPAYVQELVRLTREAGGLWIADEVQSGHGRTGDALWSFDRVGVVPDFVTLGKPMGNGHPVAAVITRSEIVSQLVGRTSLFSTFGGNPVSAAAALAVLDVIEDERVLERVQRTGRGAPRRTARDRPPGDRRRARRRPGLGRRVRHRRASPRGPRRDAPARRAGRNHRPARQRPQDPPAAGAERDPRPAARRNAAARAQAQIDDRVLHARVQQRCGAHRATSVACSTSAVNSLTASSESSSSGARTGPVVTPATRQAALTAAE